MTIKEFFRVTSLPVVLASLCCLSPVIFVLLGLSSVSVAASLTDVFYGDYRWAFRAFGLLALSVSLFMYFRKNKNICSLDQAKRRKNEIINTLLVSFIGAVLFYSFFLYGIVHFAGAYLGIWE